MLINGVLLKIITQKNSLEIKLKMSDIAIINSQLMLINIPSRECSQGDEIFLKSFRQLLGCALSKLFTQKFLSHLQNCLLDGHDDE